MVLLLVVDDRALEVRREDVAHDAHREVGLLEDEVRGERVLDAFDEHLVQLVQVLQLALEVLALGAVGGRAHDHAAAAELQVRGLAAQAFALAVLQAPRDADALAGGRVDHVAPGDRQLHRQARALRLQRVLDDLHDDLLAGLEQVGDLAPAAAAAPALGRLDARQHDLVDVQEAVLLEADVDERGLEAGQDVVDLALVDVADDRAPAAALDVELSDAVAGLRTLRRRVCAQLPPSTPPLCGRDAEEREAAGVPLASRSATRVSARSTLTSTCFFNVIQSFGIGWGRAPSGRAHAAAGARATGTRPADS